MVTKIQPGRSTMQRMGVYRLLADVAPIRTSYAGKFALAAFVGVMIPLVIFTVPLVRSPPDWNASSPGIAALVLACFMGFWGTMGRGREWLAPIALPGKTRRKYINTRKPPALPI